MLLISILNFRNVKNHGTLPPRWARKTKGGGVNISRLGVLAFVLLLCAGVLAQETAKPAQQASHSRHTKIVRMAGKVSSDGTKFVEGASQRVWLVKNVEMLRGYEGQEANLRGQIAPETNAIQVLSIGAQVSYTANWGDSAFRR